MTLEQGVAPAATHPIVVVEGLLARYGENFELEFSRYRIGPPGDQFSRPRTTFVVSAFEITRDWLSRELRNLKSDEELALHSRTLHSGKLAHIPMIDFDNDLPLPMVRELGARVLHRLTVPPRDTETDNHPTLYTFETGRSFHQYADVLVSATDWNEFLGNLLLLNPLADRPRVDIRWVGHALNRGYAALRWSRHTERYVSIPRLVDRSTIPIS